MMEFDYFNWIILPLLIFISRMCDVTLATLRSIFVSKGFKNIVPLIGFAEVLIWLLAMRQIMKDITTPTCYIGWAGGFAAGTYVGMRIEERLALGMQVIRIITNRECDQLIADLRKANHGITVVDAQGAYGPVKMIFSIVKRKNVKAVVQLIAQHNPNAFYSVEDVRNSSQGVFTQTSKASLLQKMFPLRKGK